jgi:ferritin
MISEVPDLTDALIAEFNAQLTREMHAGYLYLAMSAYLEDQDLPGMANWMRRQAQEEVGHAMRFYHHLVERGARVLLGRIEAPTATFASPLAAFEAGLAHERAVTAHIRDLYEQGMAERDHASTIFLQWFVTEQVEEEASFTQAIASLEAVGASKHGMYMLDRDMGKRE